MKQTTALIKTPSPNTGQSHVNSGGAPTGNNPFAGLFVATLSMSWQLALVVLIPIIGGFELDKKLHTLPVLTIMGFALAMAGMGFVVWRQLRLIAPLSPTQHKDARS